MEHEIEIDVDELQIEIEKERKNRRKRGSEFRAAFDSGYCIFKIPEEVSKHNEKAYSPYAFSIGPFHYSNSRTKATHFIKLRYMDDFLIRQYDDTERKWPIDLVIIIDKMSRFVLGNYDIPINHLSHNDFIKNLVLDGCFIIELFLKTHLQDKSQNVDDPIFSVSCMLKHLYHDLILLENQIPWNVLEMLFNVTNLEKVYQVSLTFLTMKFFAPILNSAALLKDEIDEHVVIRRTTTHILDLLRTSLLWRFISEPVNDWECNYLGVKPVMLSATALEESGIKIQADISASGSIFNIKFRDGILSVPQLKLNDVIDTLFRNLIYLELFCKNYDVPMVTYYVKLFDDLVQSSAVMKLLCDKTIVHNMLRLDQATRIFNQTFHEHGCQR